MTLCYYSWVMAKTDFHTSIMLADVLRRQMVIGGESEQHLINFKIAPTKVIIITKQIIIIITIIIIISTISFY